MNVSKVDEIFERFEKSRESIEIPLESIKENLQEYADSIVLYGAGSAGIAFLNYLRDAGIMPVYFSDADTDLRGTGNYSSNGNYQTCRRKCFGNCND